MIELAGFRLPEYTKLEYIKVRMFIRIYIPDRSDDCLLVSRRLVSPICAF